jgi:hypothetical protein
MPIPRLHLIEFEDEAWFPSVVRDYATDYLHFVETKMAMHRPIAAILSEVLRETDAERIVDLCSGGAGPIPPLREDLAAEGIAICFTLTDLYPNLAAFKRASQASDGAIDFCAEPVDARSVPRDMTGFRTLFNSFHHFRPSDALAILQDAADAGQPIGIVDTADRRLVNILGIWILTPTMVWLTTPLIRPFKLTRLLWTYLIPAVPLLCWWDGVVSQLRAYSASELKRMSAKVRAPGYSWQAGSRSFRPGPGRMTFLLGRPERQAGDQSEGRP